MVSRLLLASLVLGSAIRTAPALAQESLIVQGQVVERSSRMALSGVSVSLAGGSPVLTGRDGRFRFAQVRAGRYVLSVEGIGYAPEELTLAVWSDTTLLIELDRAPVQLDTVSVNVRDVTIRGEVVDAPSGVRLIDADVSATPDLFSKTDLIGRFKLKKVPSAVPLSLRVVSFGYLPFVTTFTPQHDTLLAVELKPDPVAQRMIAEQLRRIDERSEGRRYRPLPVLERSQLLLERSGLLDQVIERRLGSAMAGRIACIVVDENPIQTWRYEILLPDEVERVEIAEYTPPLTGRGGPPRRAIMVRVYTRGFVQDLVRGKAELVRKEVAMRATGGLCR